jgi:hypothetical protein
MSTFRVDTQITAFYYRIRLKQDVHRGLDFAANSGASSLFYITENWNLAAPPRGCDDLRAFGRCTRKNNDFVALAVIGTGADGYQAEWQP